MAKKKRGFVTYRTYPFRDQDPIVRDVLGHIRSYSDVEKSGGPKRTTLAHWASKKTKRPQVTTLQAALGTYNKTLVVGNK